MVQRTFYALPDEAPPDEQAWEPVPDDVHTLRYGYNIADVNRLARLAAYRVASWDSLAERYDIAWSGVVEHLYSAVERPDDWDLIWAGVTQIRKHYETETRHHGRLRPTERAPGSDAHFRKAFLRYWVPPHQAWFTERVDEAVAVWQIWHALTDRDRKVLGPLMAGLSQQDAARVLGMSRPNFVMALRNARRHFLDRWHEDETVPGRWGRVARSGETTYRSAMLAARRRPSSTLPRPECGKASTYEGGCRCIPCTTAATERNSARRRVRKGATARRFLGDADRARIVELSIEGVTVDKIMAETGWSRPTINNVRRAARKRGQL